MFKKIVVPLDGSKTAEEALECALDLARFYDGELSLIRVCDVPIQMIETSGVAYYDLEDTLQKAARAYLEAVSKKQSAAPKISTKVLTGHTVDQILESAETYQADLIVLSSHGKSGVERWVLGTVAENVTRRATCPVLLTRGGKKPELPVGKKILVPLDGSPLAEEVLPLAFAMAKRVHGELVLLRSFAHAPAHSYEYAGHDLYPDRQHLETMRQEPEIAKKYLDETVEELKTEYTGTEISQVFSTAHAPEAILEEARKQEVDLIAMTSHGLTGPGKWIFGSVAANVIQHAPCAVLMKNSR